METLIHVLAIAGAAIGATWTLRTKLSDVEAALSKHAAEDAANFKELRDVLKRRRTARKR